MNFQAMQPQVSGQFYATAIEPKPVPAALSMRMLWMEANGARVWHHSHSQISSLQRAAVALLYWAHCQSLGDWHECYCTSAPRSIEPSRECATRNMRLALSKISGEFVYSGFSCRLIHHVKVSATNLASFGRSCSRRHP